MINNENTLDTVGQIFETYCTFCTGVIWPKLNLSVIPKYFCNPKLIVIVMHVFTDGKFQLAPIGLTYPNYDALVELGT